MAVVLLASSGQQPKEAITLQKISEAPATTTDATSTMDRESQITTDSRPESATGAPPGTARTEGGPPSTAGGTEGEGVNVFKSESPKPARKAKKSKVCFQYFIFCMFFIEIF